MIVRTHGYNKGNGAENERQEYSKQIQDLACGRLLTDDKIASGCDGKTVILAV